MLDQVTPLVIVSSDTHIGPLVNEQLSAYCPPGHRSAFDDFAAAHTKAQEAFAAFREGASGAFAMFMNHPNMRTPGHYDVDARLQDMDRDGIACEVIFHGSQNNEPIPFAPQALGNVAQLEFDPELASVGLHMYNGWLADLCSVQPERHVGLAQLPMWDIEAATREVEWAADAGLKGVNFPAMRHGVYLEYNDRRWEPFWSACEARGMVLATHVGAASPAQVSGPEGLALTSIEDGGYFARRAIWWMIFGGVFERHPDLKLVITESPGDWWSHTMDELDSVWFSQAINTPLREQVPKPPSEYAMQNVFVGASFMAPFEAEHAVRDGFSTQLIWGSDYPHIESTWQYLDDDDEEPITRLALRNTFSQIPPEATKTMLGDNGIHVYGLDGDALARVASRIGAPTLAELAVPIDAIPERAAATAFRKHAAWA
jgi:predicted TIM-barrel fold metal-dependent hydrolase